MFVWTTFLEKKTRRETLYVTLSKFGYCQFFNLNKNNNPVKTNDTRNRYSTSQGHEKKKGIQNLFPRSAITISRSNKVTVGPRSSYKFISSPFNARTKEHREGFQAQKEGQGWAQRWRKSIAFEENERKKNRTIDGRVGIGREARAPGFGTTGGELFPRDEEIVLPGSRPKPREAGGFVAPSQRVLALAWFLTYVFPVYVPGFKTKPLETARFPR